jgi:cytochrome oxidase Cu insertion factor (SCO1/SenC/PrrC family)
MIRGGFVALILFFAACSRGADQVVVTSAFSGTYGPVPSFSLIERSGQPVSDQSLRGTVWVADFIFTSCAGSCPVMTGIMRQLQDTLPAEIKLVSFSVDPERDTPQVLAEYADRNGADRDRWLFVTGTKDELYRVSIDGFKLGLMETGGTEIEPITHSSRFVLVDQEGRIRGYYGSMEPDVIERLGQDARDLL